MNDEVDMLGSIFWNVSAKLSFEFQDKIEHFLIQPQHSNHLRKKSADEQSDPNIHHRCRAALERARVFFIFISEEKKFVNVHNRVL